MTSPVLIFFGDKAAGKTLLVRQICGIDGYVLNPTTVVDYYRPSVKGAHLDKQTSLNIYKKKGN